MTALKDQAIQQALQGNWDEAIAINEKLLSDTPDDIETLNRVAFAYTALRKNREAIQTYEKVLSLDNQNPIAIKNMKRLSGSAKANGNASHTPLAFALSDTMFIEEHGKTKVVELNNVAQSDVIAHLMTGEMVHLRIKRSKIFVLDNDDTFIGMLPEDLGKRLIKFMEGGNMYSACIKAIDKKSVTIFIKEVKRANRFKNQPSFLSLEQPKISSPKSKPQQKEDQEEEE
jgi:tetratricopeptide (TPR) repeat protein